MTRERIRLCIEQFDQSGAATALKEYRQVWENGRVTWEASVIEFFETRQVLGDLDEATAIWAEFESSLAFLQVPETSRTALEQAFFAHALDALAAPGMTRTARQTSVGLLWYRAGKYPEACRWVEEELRQFGEDAVLRLRLGNCCYRAQKCRQAGENYRRSVLLGLPSEMVPEIEEPELRCFLESCDDLQWGVVEAVLENKGLIKVPLFGNLDELTKWLKNEEQGASASQPPAQFFRFLVICANRQICPEEILLDARKGMKRLNPRLHATYMQRLGNL